MARKTNVSAASYVEYGYGQIEPNHLSAQRTAQIYAQLPMDVEQLENGQFVKYDYAEGKVNFSGAGEWMLVFNEVKLYGDREQYEDFVFTADMGGVPRVFKTNVGDIFTTNMVEVEDADDLEAGVLLTPNATGVLEITADAGTGMAWEVAKVYTLADGQRAVKIMRIQ